MRILLLTLPVLLVACMSAKSAPQQREILSAASEPSIVKGAIFLEEGMESTPVELNGRILYVVSKRGVTTSHGAEIEIWDSVQKKKVTEYATDLGLTSALVFENTLYIFGTTDWGHPQNSIQMVSTRDLKEWSAPITLFTAPAGTTYFNTSVTLAAKGQFIIAYEVCEQGEVCFNVRFKRSKNLLSWTDVGGVFGKGLYTACPTIRFVDGEYVVFFLSKFDGWYATMIARSADLNTWEVSKHLVLSPLDGGDQNMNASDMDLLETQGEVRILYAVGSQVDPNAKNAGVREAAFKGTLSELVSRFFP